MSAAISAHNEDLCTQDDLSVELVRITSSLRYEDLPPDVVHKLKLFLLDTFGVVGGAANSAGITELNRRLSKWETNGSATGLLGKRRYSPPTAALANGAAAHALDFDDQHDTARVHTNCVMMPTLLATAEDVGKISGKHFLLAYAVGAEMHARLGLACYNSVGKGWHPTMVFGALAASLAGARLLKLNERQTRNALGIAYHQASGSAQSMRDGVLSKRLGPGFSARAAVLSGFLAADGLTGTQRTFDGNAGLFSLYERGEIDRDSILRDLGESWRIREYSFKPYPCCRCNHTIIPLAIELAHQGIKATDIESVEIRLGKVNWLTVGEPYDETRASVAHAQFNAAYSFARALVDRRIDLRSYHEAAITEPAVVVLTRRIRVVEDQTVAPNALEPVQIKISLFNRSEVEVNGTTVKGSPQQPMSDDEIVDKFSNCLNWGLGISRTDADRFANMIMNVDKETDVGAIIAEAFPTYSQI